MQLEWKQLFVAFVVIILTLLGFQINKERCAKKQKKKRVRKNRMDILDSVQKSDTRTGMKKLYLNTPCIESTFLTERISQRHQHQQDGDGKVLEPSKVFLKMEALQNGGSYHIRGIGEYVWNTLGMHKKRYPNSDVRKDVLFVCASDIDGCIAVALACKEWQARCCIVLSESDNNSSVESLFKRILPPPTCKVIFHGKTWNDSDTYAKDLCVRSDHSNTHDKSDNNNSKEVCELLPFKWKYLVPLTDNEWVFQGYASIVRELTAVKPDCIILTTCSKLFMEEKERRNNR
ncbi:hypothetical protein RFI_01286 [Reticulomyxa filosa]|uniref:L-serine ammonia-lyase n=1 Tax=Reticulomyxa filosa TaxID=46433 RepID=X6PCH7_RETFI|nr:hypothetical protein RFI_01286 [Reticulomyxa filosa]|eukprot:ETO35779.1 hypothetical protein RFI_01286 [Reticulomyxa filosa]